MKTINSTKKNSLVCYGVSVLIFLVIYLRGAFLPGGDEMGYVLLDFYIIMPLTTLIISTIISMKKGYLFWFYPIFVGFLGMIIPFAVFNTIDRISLYFAFIPALMGLLIGVVIRVVARGRRC